jgi:hypothetical protein
LAFGVEWVSNDVKDWAMLSTGKNNRIEQIAWCVAVIFLVFVCLKAAESPIAEHGFDSVSLINGKASRFVGSGNEEQPAPVFLGFVQHRLPFVHASFLLFDFKQNLRHWPVLAGDISRSPPFLLGL